MREGIDVADTRPRVLPDESYAELDELRRFRHFKRSSYRTDHDGDKLDFLTTKVRCLHSRFVVELTPFRAFLLDLESS